MIIVECQRTSGDQKFDSLTLAGVGIGLLTLGYLIKRKMKKLEDRNKELEKG